jgi:hypothetical protein
LGPGRKKEKRYGDVDVGVMERVDVDQQGGDEESGRMT